ncbi:indolepyruvate oxidoreductase subunit beta [Raoultibacter timonensis]|uniref:indolepyruvate oxidoreductase subunit beta n=1 Tax=Raoultibacter timonensis TaxID=1907662 RepID=UPI000C856FAC|nr:indolepyruvate oxidoreductase subunit beta [Raoultibacter timonensis]
MPVNATNTTTVLLCGVGGQGTILAADLLAKTAIAAGCTVKLSEIHGMSQRGGAVTTIVRFGDDVSSMVTDPGSADYIIAFETTEALRNAPYLKQGGMLLVNDESIKPLPVLTGSASMPERARERLCELGAVLVPAGAIAKTAGNAKSTNVVLLGALASGMDFDLALWKDQIAKRVPAHTIDANLAAFRAGAEAAQGVKA